MHVKRLALFLGIAAGGSLFLSLVSCGGGGSAATQPAEDTATPHAIAKSREETGKYLILACGCNECHTDGWQEGKDVPEDKWLTGVPVGWRGPWGTTYASNLRLSVQPYTEEIFIKAMRIRDTKPPMPWRSLHAMSDADLGAIFAYIKSLGPAGDRMPAAVPAGVEPQGPYISLDVQSK